MSGWACCVGFSSRKRKFSEALAEIARAWQCKICCSNEFGCWDAWTLYGTELGSVPPPRTEQQIWAWLFYQRHDWQAETASKHDQGRRVAKFFQSGQMDVRLRTCMRSSAACWTNFLKRYCFSHRYHTCATEARGKHSMGLMWAIWVGTLAFPSRCFWHAADTAPLEGLSVLRCAIYDPLEGLQISKMRLSEMGYRIWFLASLTCCTCCRMIIRGVGMGGCISVLDEHFSYVPEHAHVAHAVVWSPGGWGVSLALSLQMEAEVLQPVERFKMAQVNHKQNIFTKFSRSFVGYSKSYRTIVAGTQQMDGTWKHLKKCWPTSMLHKKKVNKCTKKRPTAGHGVTMLPCCSLWLLRCHKRSGTEASRRGKKWMSECRPDMIRMFENHRFLVVFLGPLESKTQSPRRRNANFTLESQACQSKRMSMWQTLFDESCKYQHFVS